MRKKTALLISLALLLLAGLATQAQAAERTDGVSARSELTVQRILGLRFEQVLRLVRDLEAAAASEASGGSIGTHTIIDEPDPAGRSGGNSGSRGSKSSHDEGTSAEADRQAQQEAVDDSNGKRSPHSFN